jgi:hypothetical protein
MRSNIAEALDLRVLRSEVQDRVPYDVGERECTCHLRGREVANRHVDVGGTRLRSQLFDHGRRKLDTGYPDASATQWQGEATRADAEFKDGPTPRQIHEEVHCRRNEFRIEEVRPQGLVPLRNPSIEVVLRQADSLIRGGQACQQVSPTAGAQIAQ